MYFLFVKHLCLSDNYLSISILYKFVPAKKPCCSELNLSFSKNSPLELFFQSQILSLDDSNFGSALVLQSDKYT